MAHNYLKIDDLTYPERVRITFALVMAMEYWERTAEEFRNIVIMHAQIPVDTRPAGWGGAGSGSNLALDEAVMADQKAKLLRKWVSEMHVLDKDVKDYKPRTNKEPQ